QLLWRDVAEAWMYRQGDPRKAAAAAQKIVDGGGEPELVAEARQLLHLAWAAADEWSQLARMAADAAAQPNAGPEEAADAAALAPSARARRPPTPRPPRRSRPGSAASPPPTATPPRSDRASRASPPPTPRSPAPAGTTPRWRAASSRARPARARSPPPTCGARS